MKNNTFIQRKIKFNHSDGCRRVITRLFTKSGVRKSQEPCSHSAWILYSGTLFVGPGPKLLSCHASGTKNFEVARRFLVIFAPLYQTQILWREEALCTLYKLVKRHRVTNARYLLWEFYGTHRHQLWAKCTVSVLKVVFCIDSKYCALKHWE
jgi:hypothetical protein